MRLCVSLFFTNLVVYIENVDFLNQILDVVVLIECNQNPRLVQGKINLFQKMAENTMDLSLHSKIFSHALALGPFMSSDVEPLVSLMAVLRLRESLRGERHKLLDGFVAENDSIKPSVERVLQKIAQLDREVDSYFMISSVKTRQDKPSVSLWEQIRRASLHIRDAVRGGEGQRRRGHETRPDTRRGSGPRVP